MDMLPTLVNPKTIKLRIGKSATAFPKYIIEGEYNHDLANQGTKWFSIFVDVAEWESIAKQVVTSGFDTWLRNKFATCEKEEQRLKNEDVWNSIYDKFFD